MTVHKAARRHGDQYHCAACGRQWDHDDPEPPECKRESRVGEQAIDTMRKLFSKATLHSDK